MDKNDSKTSQTLPHRSSDDRIQQELNNVAQRYLQAMSIIFAAYYAIRSIGFLFNPGGNEGLYLSAGASAASLCGVVIFYFTKTRVVSRRIIEVSFFMISGFLMFNAALAYYLHFAPELTINVAFLIIAIGLGTISIASWALQVVVMLTAFAVLSRSLNISGDEPFLLYLSSAIALSLLAYLARIWVIRDRVRLEVELIDKAEKLEAASKAKDRFLANMTHDLRTPMTGVLGMMDLLRETRLSKEQSRLLDTAKTSAGYLLAIINDILDYSKLESGKFELKPSPIDAISLTRDVVEMLRSQAQAKSISLDLQLPEAKILPVLGDGVRVGQILFNLIGNAIKFTEKGGVGVKLNCIDRTGVFSLEWIVSDTGAGIPQSRLHKLFERFEQLDSSATREQAGTGLGLAIIKELLGIMGGHVEVSSVVGEGTEFSFSIPFERIDADFIKTAAVTENEPSPTQTNISSSLKVLVAEDNKINRALIEKLLLKLGWDIQLVENGEAAVATVTKSTEPFDLVLMDVQMPVMDGLTATKIILDKMVSPPPIIALTANTMAGDVAAYLKAGMAAHVGKPIDLSELKNTVHRVLAQVNEPGGRAKA